MAAMMALPTILARAANRGSRLPRSITAAAVTASLINSHNDRAATGASTSALTLMVPKKRGQKRLLGAWRGLSVPF